MRLSPAVRLSEYFMPTLRETPSEAEIVSHRLMLRAGMIRQESAGIYSWLPLGYRVMRKIEQIVREEMDRIGCHEILMPTIQSADLWRKSGGMTITARKCCGSRIGTSGKCCSARQTRR
jgi:prolyl-tRNA synthetase